MARNKKVEILSHDGQVLHPITDGDCVIFPDGETLTHKLSEDEAVMYTPEVTNSSPMFKVGEGDTVDYSASVLDGAYQEAILKGQTYVNTIQEPSADEITLPTPFTEYERTQSKTFTEMNSGTFGINLVGQSYVNSIQEPSKENYVALGEALEFQNKKVEYTNDGQIKSAMLKGQTLVNLFSGHSFLPNYNNISTTYSNGEYTYGAKDGYDGDIAPSFIASMNLAYNFVIGKTYTVFINQTYGGNAKLAITLRRDAGLLQTYSEANETNGLHKFTFTHSYSGEYDEVSIRLISYTSDTIRSIKFKDIMIIEGDHTQEDIPYFQGMQSVTMSTELENVCSRYNSSTAKNGKTFTVGSSTTRYLELANRANISNYGFKQNTKYLMQFKISNLNLDGLDSITLVFSNGTIAQGNASFGDNSQVPITKNGVYRAILTTSSIVNTSDFVVKGALGEWEGTSSTSRTLTISQIMCIEYQNGMENWDLPYFETTQLMKPVKVKSANKNLVNLGSFASQTKNGITLSSLNSSSIQLNGSNTTSNYSNFWLNDLHMKFKTGTYSYNFNYVSDYITYFFRDSNGNNIISTKRQDGTIAIDNDVEITQVLIQVSDNFTISNQTITIQIEEASSSTPYTPHQEKTTSALEPITLRAIGNIKDTLDLSTGEYVQRIGEIVLDGSDTFNYKFESNSNEMTTMVHVTIPNTNRTFKFYNDKLAEKYLYENTSTTEGIFSEWNGLYIRLLNSKLQSANVDGVKKYLQENPIKVQYELATPITRKISLEYPNLQTYQDITHVQSIAMDGTLIPNIYLPSDISYKTLLKPSTKYNLQLKQNVVNTDNPLTVNVGGTELAITQSRTLITTPSTLSSDTVSFTGKGNDIGEVMLIENSTLLDGDIPYFEGIGDVHLGRVVENLCMANHTTVGGATSTDTLYSDKITSKITKTGSKVHIFQLTKNLENSKRYFIYCPYDYQYIIYGFRHEYNNSLIYTYQSCEGINKKYAIFKIDGNQQKNPYTHLTVGCHGNIPVDTTMTIRRPILCEYVDGMENWDWESIGYFTGTKNIGNEFMRIGNKNLFDGVLENGMINTQGVPVLGGVSKRTVNYIEVKPNTSYTLSCDNGYNQLYIHEYDKDYQNIIEKNIMTSNTFTTEQNTMYIKFNSHATNELQANTKIQLEEASSATSYVARKHNALYIPQDESINLSFTQGGIFYNKGEAWTNATNNTNTARIRTQLFDLEPNETYRVSCGNSSYNFAVYSYDNSLVGTSDTSWLSGEYYINTTKDIHKIGIAVKRTDDANLTPSVLHQVRLEKVTDVHLRSAGDVCDELDLTRGVYVQRMHEVTLDGTGIISLNSPYSTDNTICFDFYYNAKGKIYEQSSTGGLICDKLIPKNWLHFYGSKTDEEGIVLNRDNGNTLLIKIAKSKLETEDVSGLKTYLASKPITVQYPLETPIEHKIHIPMKNESNQTIAKPNGVFTLPLMYSEINHVDLAPEHLLPKVQSRDYISYPVIASPSNKYTVFHNNIGSNLIVNLCGASTTVNTHKNTITTPSSITQYELRLSGANNKVSNICVFNGDYMNVNVPYVQGMMNAVNPIVTNTGKNLFDISKLTKTNYNSIDIAKRTVIMTPTGQFQNGGKFCFKVKKNKKYVCSVNIDGGNTSARIELRHCNGGQLIQDASVDLCTSRKTITAMGNEIQITISNGTQTSQCIFRNIQIEEASAPSQYEPYKENNCEPDYGEILSKNMFEQGSIYFSSGSTFTSMTSNTDGARVRTKQLLELEVGKTYVLKTHGSMYFTLSRFNNDEKGVNETGWTQSTIIIPTQDINKYGIAIKSNDLKLDAFNISDITLYELGKEIYLRSLPNGVRDELNLETGEYIQRVGEVVLDGSEDEAWGQYSGNNNIYYGTFAYKDVASMGDFGSGITICDKLNTPKSSTPSTSNNKYCLAPMSNKGSSGFTFSLSHTESVAEAKMWLQQNPITVQYLLKTPIVKHINIHNYPHSYKDGHVIIENGDPTTSVPAQLTYRCVTNRSGQIQEHTEQVEKQERQINELETLVLENIRMNQNRSQNFLASLISTLEIEEE